MNINNELILENSKLILDLKNMLPKNEKVVKL